MNYPTSHWVRAIYHIMNEDFELTAKFLISNYRMEYKEACDLVEKAVG